MKKTSNAISVILACAAILVCAFPLLATSGSKEKGVEVNQTHHFDNIEMVKEAVAQKAGVSILWHRVMRDDLRQKRLTAIRLAGAALYRPLGIIHRNKEQFHRALQAFLDMLCDAPVE
jgi:DNA-binding transcriptional LysR family regulator